MGIINRSQSVSDHKNNRNNKADVIKHIVPQLRAARAEHQRLLDAHTRICAELDGDSGSIRQREYNSEQKVKALENELRAVGLNPADY
jgi:hypothetical protein